MFREWREFSVVAQTLHHFELPVELKTHSAFDELLLELRLPSSQSDDARLKLAGGGATSLQNFSACCRFEIFNSSSPPVVKTLP